MYLSQLSLLNVRNYERLQVELGPGVVLVQGNNGHGKSNLLEALYLLVIAKSQRASTERELVRRESVGVEFFSQVAAVVQREDGPVRVQVDFKNTVSESSGDDANNRLNVQKYVRVNGIPRRASELVGEINAVMFSAQDLDMVYGSPGLRRRYMDILISQVDREYLRAVQRYQRVVVQRNHLLKGIKAGRSRPSDLEFWDGELVKSGGAVVARRREALEALSKGASRTHATLTDDDDILELAYRPSFTIDGRHTPEDIGEAMREALAKVHSREIAQGFSVRGPHRDDFQLLLNGMDVGLYASRGQARTAVLALKLAEAEYLRDVRNQQPVLLLDDVLSELDAPRRRLVLERVSNYSQVFITTADVDVIEPKYLSNMKRFVVDRGQLERVNA
ncbi:MAG: DNA replication/repair protein RecF [Chloroflexi bacterium]|nr:DNA replication/repair protein RecF [Chloroflexota bacterium]